MKKNILFLLFSLASLAAFAQSGSVSYSVIRSRVNDSTTVVPADASGYGSLYWNNQDTNPGWRVWVDGTGYVIWDPTASGSGGGTVIADYVTSETPSGSVNGSNVTFTLANTPIGFVHVFLNGVLQESGGGNDYTISGDTITMATAPETGSKVRVSYIK